MKIHKAYKIRIYPNANQRELIEKTLGCVRQVYNDFLSMCEERYQKDPTYYIKKFELIKMLPEYKEGYSYLKDVDSIALQQAIIHLHAAYVNFFRHNAEFPKPKKKKNDHGYITMNVNSNVRLGKNDIQIPKLGKVKAKCSFNIPNDFSFTTVSVSKTIMGYFVTLIGEEDNSFIEEITKALDPNNSIGLDFSMSNLFVDSNGNKTDMPKYYTKALKRLNMLYRNASRCKKGSNNRIKAYNKLRKYQAHIANQKKDYLHKLSFKMANIYDYVFVEDLNIKKMACKDNKLKLGKSLIDRPYAMFINFLSYKLEWRNKKLIRVDRYFPSSKLCSECGYKNDNLSLEDRSWICPKCGKVHNRDVNAAINIRNEGLRLLALSN